MVNHKFLSPKLAASAAIAYLGLSPTSIAGLFVAWAVNTVVNLLANAGLRTMNVVAINFVTEQEQREFDKEQSLALDTNYVASLTDEERRAKSKQYRATFRKFVSFGFINKSK